jgi:hypothetical protein
MKLDPGMHINLHLVFFGKTGVTPCEVILECIKLYKVRRKPWGLSGSSAIVFDPSACCGVARTLCEGHGDPLPKWRSSLVEAASR